MANAVPASEARVTPESDVEVVDSPAPAMGLARATWERWKQIARAIGVVQTRLLMIAFYVVLVLPLGLVMRLVSDRLHLRRPKNGNWLPHRQEPQSLETARRQF
ncbi:hypothetical protein L6Q96_06150 [Candidatus Binatia bacterium]|nr:hypothetical protein [Candidatus Binatia bacterium]